MKECTPADKQFQYNYIIIGADDDYIRAMYGELDQLPNVHFKAYGQGSKNRILRAIFKLHWSAKLNAKIRLPFKRIWFSKMCSYDFKNKKPVCYIFLGGQYIAGNPKLQSYIRSLNPENRIVIKYEDLIAKKKYRDFETVRLSADLLVTYDETEAEQYGIALYDCPKYSRLQEITEPKQFDSDVYFLGNAKDRLDTILAVYNKLTDDGLSCKFYLAGVPAEKQIQLPGILYTQGITYAENLKNVNQSKCILEICQSASTALTLRCSEAITYHRLLLTNSGVRHTEYYLPAVMLSFEKPEGIDTERLKREIDYRAFAKSDIDLSPIQMLRWLERELQRVGN